MVLLVKQVHLQKDVGALRNRIRIRKFQEAGEVLIRGTYRLPR